MGILTIDHNQFLLDGKPFRIISGALHYFRILPEYWEDRLKKLKACGFNTVETYTCWNLHERKEGQFDFSGRLDIERFISIAEQLDLNIVRGRISAPNGSSVVCQAGCSPTRTWRCAATTLSIWKKSVLIIRSCSSASART